MPILITVQLWYFPKWVGAARLLAGARYLRPALAASYTLPSPIQLLCKYLILRCTFPSSGQKSITGLSHSTLYCSANILLFCVFYRQITLAAFYSPLSTSAHSYWQFADHPGRVWISLQSTLDPGRVWILLQITLIEYEYLCPVTLHQSLACTYLASIRPDHHHHLNKKMYLAQQAANVYEQKIESVAMY